MDLLGPLALAQADGEHLQQAALVPAGERGVRLDPVEQDDPVGLEGVPVEVDRQAEAVGAEDGRFHLGPDRAAERRLGDAELGEQRPLPFGRPAAVAAHRRDDERAEAQGLRARRPPPSAIRSIPAIPRLPTVRATEPPGFTRAAIRLDRMAWATAPGTSCTSGWSWIWRTRAIGGTLILGASRVGRCGSRRVSAGAAGSRLVLGRQGRVMGHGRVDDGGDVRDDGQGDRLDRLRHGSAMP